VAWIHDIGSLSDFVVYTVLCAPDSFADEDLKLEEQLNLERAFEELRHGVDLIEPTKMDDAQRKEALAVLEESLNSYRAGDQVEGKHRLREFEALIFGK